MHISEISKCCRDLKLILESPDINDFEAPDLDGEFFKTLLDVSKEIKDINRKLTDSDSRIEIIKEVILDAS